MLAFVQARTMLANILVSAGCFRSVLRPKIFSVLKMDHTLHGKFSISTTSIVYFIKLKRSHFSCLVVAASVEINASAWRTVNGQWLNNSEAFNGALVPLP